VPSFTSFTQERILGVLDRLVSMGIVTTPVPTLEHTPRDDQGLFVRDLLSSTTMVEALNLQRRGM
jgi:hypothetical protein